MSSRIPGFYRLSPHKRLDALQQKLPLERSVLETYRGDGLTLERADLMVENVISTFALPNAVGINFLINGVERVVPMVVEEPSVVAAVSNMAKLTRACGGFTAEADPSWMIGQVQLMDVQHPEACVAALREALPRLEAIAAEVHPRLVERGGGMRGMEVRHVVYDEPGFPREDMVVLHFLLDCVDAMGANMVNTVAERLAPELEELTGQTVGLRILSNLADKRLARARCELSFDVLTCGELTGREVAEGIAASWRFAWADPYRAATHNKGVMNGIDAVALATGNDWRAIEAGAHAHTARDGHYRPMTTWRIEGDKLVGTIELPMQVGTVGGPIRVHPTVQSNLAVLNCTTAPDLASVMVAVGLAQNLGALRALATEGIQQGHMRMHARSVAATAGATPEEAHAVSEVLFDERDFSVERARRALAELRGE